MKSVKKQRLDIPRLVNFEDSNRKIHNLSRDERRGRNFVQIDKKPLLNSRLSLRAKGLLALALSFPPDTVITSTVLQSFCKEGRDTIRKILRELETAGHAEFSENRGLGGVINGKSWEFYESPKNNDLIQTPERPEDQKPGLQASGYHQTPENGNPTIYEVSYNTKDKDKDIEKTKDLTPQEKTNRDVFTESYSSVGDAPTSTPLPPHNPCDQFDINFPCEHTAEALDWIRAHCKKTFPASLKTYKLKNHLNLHLAIHKFSLEQIQIAYKFYINQLVEGEGCQDVSKLNPGFQLSPKVIDDKIEVSQIWWEGGF